MLTGQAGQPSWLPQPRTESPLSQPQVLGRQAGRSLRPMLRMQNEASTPGDIHVAILKSHRDSALHGPDCRSKYLSWRNESLFPTQNLHVKCLLHVSSYSAQKLETSQTDQRRGARWTGSLLPWLSTQEAGAKSWHFSTLGRPVDPGGGAEPEG